MAVRGEPLSPLMVSLSNHAPTPLDSGLRRNDEGDAHCKPVEPCPHPLDSGLRRNDGGDAHGEPVEPHPLSNSPPSRGRGLAPNPFVAQVSREALPVGGLHRQLVATLVFGVASVAPHPAKLHLVLLA